MNKLNQLSNVLNSILILLIVAIMYWANPTYEYAPKGILLPIDQPMAPLWASGVKLLKKAPVMYKPLARINLEKHMAGESQQLAVAQIIATAQKMAGAYGANAIIVKAFGHTSGELPTKGLAMYEFQGIAIYTPKTIQIKNKG